MSDDSEQADVGGFFSMIKMTGGGVWAQFAAHNLRERIAATATHIDSARSHLNEVLRGPTSVAGITALVSVRMAQAGIEGLRVDAVRGIGVLFSLPPRHNLNEAEYFEACLRWCAGWCGGPDNLLSAVIHRDEGAPHCHVLVLPLIDGHMRGSALFGSLGVLTARQADFRRKVAHPFGLRRLRTMSEIFTSTGTQTAEDRKPIGFGSNTAAAPAWGQRPLAKPMLCRLCELKLGLAGLAVGTVAQPVIQHAEHRVPQLPQGWDDLSDLQMISFSDWARGRLNGGLASSLP